MITLNQTIKVAVFALGLSSFGLAPVSQAVADQRGKHYRVHDRGPVKPHVRKHRSKLRYYGDKYYGHHRYGRPHYRSSYRGHYRGHYRRHYRRHGGGDVVLGVLAGGMLFHALNNHHREPDRTVYVSQQPAYNAVPDQQWTRPAPAAPIERCLQKREYQTTITVGGKTVPAYGQSCLQPDGSWKLGPATPEPGY